MADEWFDIASDPGVHRVPDAVEREYTFVPHSPSGVMLRVRDVADVDGVGVVTLSDSTVVSVPNFEHITVHVTAIVPAS